MKIKKNLFSYEVEFNPDELVDLKFKVPSHMGIGLLVWIKEKFRRRFIDRCWSG
mgnify:CR=1 FL=1